MERERAKLWSLMSPGDIVYPVLDLQEYLSQKSILSQPQALNVEENNQGSG